MHRAETGEYLQQMRADMADQMSARDARDERMEPMYELRMANIEAVLESLKLQNEANFANRISNLITRSLPVMTHVIQPSSPIVPVTLKEYPETTLVPEEGARRYYLRSKDQLKPPKRYQ